MTTFINKFKKQSLSKKTNKIYSSNVGVILANYETLCFNTSAIAHGLPVVEVSYIATGPWHVNYVKANDPGLDYGIQLEYYVPYLRGLG